MEIDCCYKKWDSEFFNMKIGEACLYDISELDYLNFIRTIDEGGYNLIYLLPQDTVSFDILQKNQIPLLDKKIKFSKSMVDTKPRIRSEKIRPYIIDECYSQLLQLAYSSGQFSRFRLDPNFGKNCFKALYKEWLDNSINKKIADDILVWDDSNQLRGFVSYKIVSEYLKIGLIAVDKNSRGTGIGKGLMNYMEYIANENDLILKVDAQEHNLVACKFYRSLGYTIDSIQPIFHLWIK